MSESNLLDWYQSLNEEEGIAKITVPVINQDDGPEVEVPSSSEEEEKADNVDKTDKGNSLLSFVIVKRIQDLLMRLAEFKEPYESDSVERQNVVDKIKKLYMELGNKIGEL